MSAERDRGIITPYTEIEQSPSPARRPANNHEAHSGGVGDARNIFGLGVVRAHRRRARRESEASRPRLPRRPPISAWR